MTNFWFVTTVIVLGVALVANLVRVRRLTQQLALVTYHLQKEQGYLVTLTLEARSQTGFSSIQEVINGYRRLCGSLGYHLHNWGHERPISDELRSHLGDCGNVLRSIGQNQSSRAQGPQVISWETHRWSERTTVLQWASPELQPLLDGLTMTQVARLVVLLLDGHFSLGEAFHQMGICLLTPEGRERASRDSTHARIAAEGKQP